MNMSIKVAGSHSAPVPKAFSLSPQHGENTPVPWPSETENNCYFKTETLCSNYLRKEYQICKDC